MPNFLMNIFYGVSAAGLGVAWYFLLASPEEKGYMISSLAVSLLGIFMLLVGGWRRNT